ncbi:MAG TPA: ATP-binding protein [Gemmataceae bacterium]|nr:ATP-binding protein [Gemmataceae bacterium]
MWAIAGRYTLLPLACVVLAAIVEKLLEPLLSPSFFLPFLAAVAVSALYGGMLAGAVATLCSALLVDYLYLEPIHSLGISSPRDVARLCVFLSVALLINFLTRERIARLRAETQRKATQDLLSEIAHELRTPMTSIIGWIDILRGSSDAEDTEHAYEVIERNLKLQNMLLEDILCAARLVQGKLELHETRVDLRDSTDVAIDIVRPLAAKKGVELRWQKPDGGVFVNGDSARLVQVLWNLLTNAIKFSRQEGVVIVTMVRNQADAEIDVADNGIGIRRDQLNKIFEKWAQASSQENFGGVGLGLWIARSITQLHHGGIAVSSSEGEGARFTVRLPLASPVSDVS